MEIVLKSMEIVLKSTECDHEGERRGEIMMWTFNVDQPSELLMIYHGIPKKDARWGGSRSSSGSGSHR